jgi:hypothetical protein
MGIFEDQQKKIDLLTNQREELINSKDDFSKYNEFLLMCLNSEIADSQQHLEKFRIGRSLSKCSFCNNDIFEIENASVIESIIICINCKTTMKKMKTSNDVETNRALKKGKIKDDRFNGKLKIYEDAGLVFNSGGFWLIHEHVEELMYGDGKRKSGIPHNISNLIEEYKIILFDLKQRKESLILFKDISRSPSFLFQLSLDSQISDIENRILTLNNNKMIYRCNECQGWIRNERLYGMSMIDNYVICDCCKSLIKSVMTSNEAESLFNLKTGTIRQDCFNNSKLKLYEKGGFVWKSGLYRLLHRFVLEHYYLKHQHFKK